MAERFKFRLRLNGFAAQARFFIGIALFGAGCRSTLFGNFPIVVKSGDNLLRNGYGFANGAPFALGETGFGAGCRNGRNNNFGVGNHGNNFLLNNRMANRAGVALSETGCGAGCGNGFLNFGLCVREFFNSLTGSVIAALALAPVALGVAGGQAGCRNGFDFCALIGFVNKMTESRFFNIGCVIAA